MIFESEKARKKWQVTEIHRRFGDKEIILSLQKRRSGPLRNEKEPISVTLFLPEYISDQPVRLPFSKFGKGSICLLADINLTGIYETERGKHCLFKVSFNLLISFNKVSNIF